MTTTTLQIAGAKRISQHLFGGNVSITLSTNRGSRSSGTQSVKAGEHLNFFSYRHRDPPPRFSTHNALLLFSPHHLYRLADSCLLKRFPGQSRIIDQDHSQIR